MTGDAKLLKLSCIAALFAGLAAIVAGTVLAIGNLADIDAWVTTGEGLASTVFGTRCAILANVPSNTSKVRTKSVAIAVVAAASLAYMIYARLEATTIQLTLAAVIGLLALCSLVVASRIVTEQLRK